MSAYFGLKVEIVKLMLSVERSFLCDTDLFVIPC